MGGKAGFLGLRRQDFSMNGRDRGLEGWRYHVGTEFSGPFL